MKNILVIGLGLMTAYVGLAVVSAQEKPRLVRKDDAKGRVKGVIGAPFSAVAVTESSQTLADGNRIVTTREQKLYRDSQGRERSELGPSVSVLGEQVALRRVTISDPVEGVSYVLNPEALTADKRSALSGAIPLQLEMVILQGVSGARMDTEQLPATTIEGVSAQGRRTIQTVPAGKIGNQFDIQVVDEVWYSPDLHMNVMTKHSDPRSGETTMRFTNINRSEPDPALFQVPAGYTVTEQKAPTRVALPNGETLFITDPPAK